MTEADVVLFCIVFAIYLGGFISVCLFTLLDR